MDKEIIYRELIAIFLETPENEYIHHDIWERVNSLLREIITEKPKYFAYLLTSENAGHSVHATAFKQKLRSAITVMGIEFNLEDLTDIIKKNRQESGMNVHNNATSNPIQNVSQNVEVSVEEKILIVTKEIENNLSDEQLEKIRTLIDSYKEKPTRNATEKLISGILDFGKDVAVGVISNIVSKQLGS